MSDHVSPAVLRRKLKRLSHPLSEERRRAKAAYDARWHREHRATGRPTGRPRTSAHPRAAYWRAYYARTAQQESKP